jgi:sterol desaturase/sphingolipid hydroxylase (fatty acid hydroxylase superfamily)
MELLRATAIGLLPFFFAYLAAMGIEALLVARRPRLRGYDVADTATNVGTWLVAMAAWIPINVATYLIAAWLWRHRVVDLGVGPAAWVVAALGWDLSFYWQHRLTHTVRLLWAGHVTHHSSERFNYSTGFRQSWTPWTGALFYSAWALVGVRPELIFVAGGWNLVYQFFLHTELVGKLPRWAEWLLNTPSHHRVHHAKNAAYHDRNFGGALIVWDRLFGTFAEEREQPVYGITTPLWSRDPLTIQLQEYAAIARDVVRARSWRSRLAFVLRDGDRFDDVPAPAARPSTTFAEG